MPKPSFFSSLGLFVQSDFLDAASRAQIREQVLAGEPEKATVVGSDPERGTVNETVRNALWAKVEKSTVKSMKERLLELKPRLEDHFRLSLSGFETPEFLRYGQGAFYKPHRDATPDSPADVVGRRVSVVIFLNAQAAEPSPNCYGGGSLKFYGLLNGLKWENCGFPMEAEPGLLVGFPSDILHEVEPVTFGQRFTIVSWFTV